MLITNLVEKSDRILNADEAQRDVHATTFRVYGSDHFDRTKFLPVRNGKSGWLPKPAAGGLYSSPLDKPNSFTWHDFCVSEEFDLDELNKHFDFRLKPNARVLIVRSIEDLRRFGTHLIRKDDFFDYDEFLINFVAIAREYDALAVIGYYMYDRDSMFNYPGCFYSWDVDTLLVLNPDAVMVSGS